MERRILVVEDSPTQAAVLVRLLREQGFEVVHVEDGQAALDYLKQDTRHCLDLVVSDVVMPKVDGFQLCQAIRDDPDWENLPVVLLTGLSEPDEIIKGMECRCDNFILKPYEPHRLILRLNSLLGKRRREVMEEQQEELTHASAVMAGGSSPMPGSKDSTAGGKGIPIRFAGKMHYIDSNRQQILDLLLSVLEETYVEGRRLQAEHAQSLRSGREARSLRRLLAAQLQTHQDGALIVDSGGTVVYANSAAAAVFGLLEDQLQDRRLELPLSDGAEVEAEVPHADGTSVRVRLSVSDVLWEGKNQHFVSLHVM